MTGTPTQLSAQAAGVRRGNDYRNKVRIVVAFDPDTFDEINKRANTDGTSFAEQVRILVEWGLEA